MAQVPHNSPNSLHVLDHAPPGLLLPYAAVDNKNHHMLSLVSSQFRAAYNDLWCPGSFRTCGHPLRESHSGCFYCPEQELGAFVVNTVTRRNEATGKEIVNQLKLMYSSPWVNWGVYYYDFPEHVQRLEDQCEHGERNWIVDDDNVGHLLMSTVHSWNCLYLALSELNEEALNDLSQIYVYAHEVVVGEYSEKLETLEKEYDVHIHTIVAPIIRLETRESTLPNVKLCALHLNLENCKNIESLPVQVRNTSLIKLILAECEKLKSLPEWIGDLWALTKLDLAWCKKIESLPEQFGELRSLTDLDVGDCYCLASLPERFEDLVNLKTLRMSACTTLTSLPERFGQLKSLQELKMVGCVSLLSLPDSVCDLSNLKRLMLGPSNRRRRGCEKLQSLPDRFGDLDLNELNLGACVNLNMNEEIQKIIHFKHLEKLAIWKTNISLLPEGIRELGALTSLEFDFCPLKSLPKQFGELGSLASLKLTWCDQLESLPEEFGDLAQLQELDLGGCTSLVSLPERFVNLNSLTELNLHLCKNLTSLPARIGDCKSLTFLNLEYCSGLVSLPDSIGELKSLTSLNISGDALNKMALKSLPDRLGECLALETLNLEWNKSLVSLPDGLGKCKALKTLSLKGCTKLASLPDSIGDLKALTALDLSSCIKLTSLPEGIGELQNLKYLDLRHCQLTMSLTLKKLAAQGCKITT